MTQFEKWLHEVDNTFIDIVGLPRDSWPDQDYWSMWDAGESPREAVQTAIENEYGDYGLEAFGMMETA